MEHPIGALPRTPFPASRDFPSRGNERYEEKNRESYTSGTTPTFPPLVAGATTFPRKRWDNQGEALHPLNLHAAGVSNGAAGKGEASAASQSAECLS